ncbi:LuxR C-terminal-related transcriptional regulator [Nocardiopsis aegyptia]|uniref:LuxR C-terminal-related transcriptional regulator n=1 Tax=Nocardiopsis aegyptia TaxID=220378 RepID=UPI00366ED873
MLSALGVDTTAVSVYQAMVDHPRWGITQISVHLALAETDVHAALDRLVGLRLLRPKFADSSVLRPVRLDIAVQILLARREEQAHHPQERLAAGRAAALELLESQEAGGESAYQGETMSSIEQVQDCLERLAHSCVERVWSFHPGGAQPSAQLEASRPLDGMLLERGVDMRTLYQDSVRNDQDTLGYARWLTESGARVRTAPVLPVRMVLFDDSVVLPLDPDDTGAGAVRLSGRGVITALAGLHTAVWEQASPFGIADRKHDGDDALDGQERQMLKLLAQGATDEVVARQLGIGVRTARRMMAALMQRLQARSRFEAGVLAQRRAWLSLA